MIRGVIYIFAYRNYDSIDVKALIDAVNKMLKWRDYIHWLNSLVEIEFARIVILLDRLAPSFASLFAGPKAARERSPPI